MAGDARRKPLRLVLENGEPSAVILDIDDYKDTLDRLDDVGDSKVLQRMWRRPLKFRKLEEFLAEYAPRA